MKNLSRFVEFSQAAIALRWLPSLALAVAILLSALQAHAAIGSELADLASGEGKRIGRGVDALGASRDPQALAALEALAEGTLVYDVSSRRVQWPTRKGLWDANSGQLVSEQARVTEHPVVNNRLRRRVATALARARLRSSDVSRRRLAAASLADGPPDALLVEMRTALSREKDDEVRSSLRLAVAYLDLAALSPERQLSGLRAVDRETASAFLNQVRALANRDSSRGKAEVSEEVAVLATAVLGRLERRMLLVSGLANLFYGLSLGSVLLLAALGLAITFGLMRVINMAHGEMLMIGAYSTYVVQGLISRWLPSLFDFYLVLALPVAFLSCALVGVLLERTVIRFLYGRPLETLLATWGISLILIQTVRLVFGAQNVAVENPAWLSGGWQLSPTVVLPYSRIAVLFFCSLVVVLVWALLQRTRLGVYVRAVTQNREMAANVGIRTQRIDIWTFGLGSGVAGLGGVALSQLGNVGPELGQSYIVDSFMVVVLGGVGSIVGTVAGALGLGVANKLLEPALGAVMGKILLLGVLIVFIQWRPQGMFAPKGRAAEL